MQKDGIKTKLKELSKIKELKVTISHIVKMLGKNAGEIVIIIFCAPTALPTPALPVLTQILSAVVIVTLGQLLLRKKTIWLPKKLGDKELSNEIVVKTSNKLLHYHAKIEKIIKPRVTFLSSITSRSIIYFYCCALSIIVALPIPFSNTVPSIAIIVIMLGLIERDGIIILLGVAIGIIGVVSLFYAYYFGFSLFS